MNKITKGLFLGFFTLIFSHFLSVNCLFAQVIEVNEEQEDFLFAEIQKNEYQKRLKNFQTLLPHSAQALSADMQAFTENYFKKNSLLKNNIQKSPEFLSLVNTLSVLGIEYDQVLFAYEMFRDNAFAQIGEALNDVLFMIQNSDQKIPLMVVWDAFESRLQSRFSKEDIKVFFIGYFLEDSIREALEIQQKLGFFKEGMQEYRYQYTDEYHLETRKLQAILTPIFELDQKKSLGISDRIKEALSSVRKNGADAMKKEIREIQIKKYLIENNPDLVPEDIGLTSAEYSFFYDTLANQTIRLYECVLYMGVSLKVLLRQHAYVEISQYLGKEEGEKARLQFQEDSTQDIIEIQRYFNTHFGGSIFGTEKEFADFSFASPAFILQFTLFPITETAAIILAPLQIPQDVFAVLTSNYFGLDAKKDYIRLTKENKMVGKSRMAFSAFEAVAAIYIALRTTGGASLANGGWRALSLRTAKLVTPSILLSGTIATAQGWFDAGGFEKATLANFNFRNLLTQTIANSIQNLKYVAMMGVFRKLAALKGFSGQEVFNTSISLEVWESSPDLADSFRMFESAENWIQYIGAVINLAGNIYDWQDATLALTQSQKTADILKNTTPAPPYLLPHHAELNLPKVLLEDLVFVKPPKE